jgi:Domain of unknown function (DUF1918)
MHAQVGDRLVVAGRFDGARARRAEIISVPAANGAPPYRVRWLDTGHESLIIPGADARIVSAAASSRHDHLEVRDRHNCSTMKSCDDDPRTTELLTNPGRYFARARKAARAEIDRDIAATMRRSARRSESSKA